MGSTERLGRGEGGTKSWGGGGEGEEREGGREGEGGR